MFIKAEICQKMSCHVLIKIKVTFFFKLCNCSNCSKIFNTLYYGKYFLLKNYNSIKRVIGVTKIDIYFKNPLQAFVKCSIFDVNRLSN